jgi:hypothetical protein
VIKGCRETQNNIVIGYGKGWNGCQLQISISYVCINY